MPALAFPLSVEDATITVPSAQTVIAEKDPFHAPVSWETTKAMDSMFQDESATAATKVGAATSRILS